MKDTEREKHRGGRPRILIPSDHLEAILLSSSMGVPLRLIAQDFGLSKNTVHRAVKKAKEAGTFPA